ncbi:MAG: DNA recombination protein RmuC [Alphaproteobacteria bacterium]|nr:DNA recombination protein RmuC [Alphaproteobacteria bacterium]MBU6471054.1 DNA recombination protein RmuC [Alphaproteobacteria bacterium]MDE2012243.1 DNA recombination protein RmuC [Alphaproteobacteria bacterium]MDE2074462.1 DNA recombination protein RmuC [Alphaproteobacteria bacterium]MDE2352718.1 DNA recombination protein RmuC [Alphaproteobacteria bacterium]
MDSALILLGFAVVVAAAILAVALLRRPAPAPESAPPPPDPRLDTLLKAQGEISGRFQQTLEAQAQLQKALGERLDALNQRLGQSLSDSAEKTAATLSGITERLCVIDEAQKNVTALSGHVVSLQEILSDKQTRGAFGQERMEAIVSDQLPPDHYAFQHTLTNGSRPDCIIRIPNVAAVIVVDSKFPLEAYEALRTAANDAEAKAATQRLRADMQKHVRDISEKYLIPGETQTPALMFVPSESLYAELHSNFADLVQRARRAQVVIVSPHVFMLAINTIQTLMRDAKMREQASLIQKEVALLLVDVNRLSERIGALRQHFDRTNKDIGEIETSLKKIASRADGIEKVELAAPEGAKALPKG